MYSYMAIPFTGAEAARRAETEKKHGYRQCLGSLVGQLAREFGPTRAAELAGMPDERGRKVAEYWREKVNNPMFHPGAWGGRRSDLSFLV